MKQIVDEYGAAKIISACPYFNTENPFSIKCDKYNCECHDMLTKCEYIKKAFENIEIKIDTSYRKIYN